MSFDVPPPPKKLSPWNPLILGFALILIGFAKILDVFTFMSALDPSRGLVLGISAGAILVGIGLVAIGRRSRPSDVESGRKRLEAIRERRKAPEAAKEGGFTLIEVVITIALVALIFAMVSGILVSVLNANETVSRRLDREKVGHGVLALLQRELQGCVAYGLGPVVFKGEDKNLSGREADEVYFVTTAPGDTFDPESGESETADTNLGFSGSSSTDPNAPQRRPKGPRYRKVAYALRQSPGAANSGVERFVLVRRAVAYSTTDRDVTSAEGPFVEVVDGLLGVRFEYQAAADANWQDGWTDTATLPTAIRVTVQASLTESEALAAQAGGPVAEPETYSTIISLLSRGRLPETEQATTGN